jgi:hypothetical protein
MDVQLHLRVVAYFIEANATYSDTRHARIISVPCLLAVYNRIVLGEVPDLPHDLSLDEALEMGVRDGLWGIEYDKDIDIEIVVLP